jgi:hypothetical protein
VVGLATHTAAAPADSLHDVTRFSAGVKVSLLRGRIDPATVRQIDQVRHALSALAKTFDAAYDSIRATDPRTRHLDSLVRAIAFNPNLSFEEKELLSAPIREQKNRREDTLRQYVRENIATGDFDRARQALENVRVRRIGPKLDLAAAFAWDFPGMSFDDSRFSAWAAWMTFGYEYDYGLSLLGIFRYNYFNGTPPFGSDQLVQYKDDHGLDAGVRVIYSHPSSRFGAGFEGIRRSMTGSSATASSWRFTANAEYEVGRNKKLSLVFGRDFEGNYTGEGDLIVALNLLLGFGTGKKL